MNTSLKEFKNIEMKKLLPAIDVKLVSYYASLTSEVRDNDYKNNLMNLILLFYFSNKTIFRAAPLELKYSFSSAKKSIITVSLDDTNSKLFEFCYLSNNRTKKTEAEFILTSILLTFKYNRIDEIIVTDEGELKFYNKKRLFKF
jgi:hypothetical protein